MSETTHETFRLARFVAVLALERSVLQDYLAVPEELMEANGLSERERELLRSGTLQEVLDYLWVGGPKPAPDDETGGGSG